MKEDRTEGEQGARTDALPSKATAPLTGIVIVPKSDLELT